MIKEEIQQEFILELLKIVNTYDEDFQAAYEQRNKALTKLNEWVIKVWNEATDVKAT